MVERDPLDPLRDAWRDVQPPPPDADPYTYDLVDELRAAWHTVATAPAAVPTALRRALARRRRLRLVRVACAAAAFFLAWFALALLVGDDALHRADDRLATETLDAQVARDATADDAPPSAAGNAGSAPPVENDSRFERLPHDVRARPTADGGLELRRGVVRLVLGGVALAETTTILDDEAADAAADDD